MSTSARSSSPQPVYQNDEAASSWTRDLRTVRTVRFTLGTTVAAAIAYAFEWPLFFLTPVLTIAFLSLPLPGVTAGHWLKLLVYIAGAMLIGAALTFFVQNYPLIYVLLLGVVLFHIYYLVNRGGSFIFALMSLLAVLLIPMLSSANATAGLGFAWYFALSAGLSVLIFALAQVLLPDPVETPAYESAFQRGYSATAARAALKSTIAVLPLVVLFLSLELYGQILVMAFAAIFSLIPDLSTGWAAGRRSLRSTLLGCLAAIVFYWLLVAVPEFHFFLLLWSGAMLLFARLIFSEHPLAQYMGSAAIAMTILVSGSIGPGADFVDKLVTRVVLIMLATLWVVAAIALLDRYVFRQK